MAIHLLTAPLLAAWGGFLLYQISQAYHSPNQGSREGAAITALILHATVGSANSALNWLCNPVSGVSSHYVIDKAGNIAQLVSDEHRAWHAGVSSWHGVPDVNDYSVSVELENRNDGHDPYPTTQIDALKWLTKKLLADHPTLSSVASHAEVALPVGRKTDPANFPLILFRAWFAALTPQPPPIAHGFVLTNILNMTALRAAIDTGRYNALKVVTAWGMPGQWVYANRRVVAGLTPTLIVRTHAGDPSSGKPFLHHEEVVAEIAPWYAIKPDLWIELGNEPNSADVDPFGYRYHLDLAINACRSHFPGARLIAPALLLDKRNLVQWLDICGSEYRRCDAVGVHIYAYSSLANDDTHQQATAEQMYQPFTLPFALTEYGINDKDMSKAAKGAAYARFVQSLPAQYSIATAYHVDQGAAAGSNDAYYHLPIDAHRAYANTTKAT